MSSGSSVSVNKVTYVVWELCKDKRGRLGFHQKVVSDLWGSEAVCRLVCLRCKHLRVCPKGCSMQCVFGRALRYKPCGNFAVVVSSDVK